MKKIYLFSILSSLPMAAFATPNLNCGYADMNFPYWVNFQATQSVAKVSLKNKPAEFGDLNCWNTNNTKLFEPIVTCTSNHVADAGFKANIFRNADKSYTLDLYEVSFRGTHLLVTIPCWHQL